MNRPLPLRCLALLALALRLVATGYHPRPDTRHRQYRRPRCPIQATNQYLGEAEVTLEGTAYRALTDRDGSYSLSKVKPGTYTAAVAYAGLDTQKQTVTVGTGGMLPKISRLPPVSTNSAHSWSPAKSRATPPRSTNRRKPTAFMTAISADTLGEVPEGNVGEFLECVARPPRKLLHADASTVSVRGQDPEATLFTIDGQVPAAAGSPPRSSTGSSDASSRSLRVHPSRHHQHRVR